MVARGGSGSLATDGRPVVAERRWTAPSGRAIGLIAALSLALGLLATLLLSQRSTPVPRIARQHSLVALPPTLAGPASSALGAHDSAYAARAGAPAAITAANPAQRLSTRFEASGVSVRAAHARLSLRAAAIGTGADLRALAPAQPRARGNRVVYQRANVTEWYANGPLGLEQGFTVPRAPASTDPGPLTIALAVGGGTRPELAPGGRSVTFYSGARTALTYGDLSATDARGRSLGTSMAVERGRLLLRIDAPHAAYPINIDPLLQNGNEREEGGEFGYSVSMSEDGTTAIVGGPGNQIGTRIARVYVFHRSGAVWTQQAKLSNPGSSSNGFGDSVALSADGNTAIIGAPFAGEGQIGVAYMFTRSGTTWTSTALIGCNLVTEEENCVHFGSAVSVSGDGHTAIIGAEAEAGPSDAWAYTREGETWTRQGVPLVEGESERAEPSALSSDGNTALVSATS